jgi:hypothetical protein
MKPWLVLFLTVLVAGVAWGLARDIFSRPRATRSGTVVSVDFGNPLPKWLPATPPRYKVRLDDGSLVDAATREPQRFAVGSAISLTEWVTPWGQVWYTQRD